MKSQLKKGVLELCVLATICEKDCYGYEVVSILKNDIEVTESTIYPILRRLTKSGIFTTYLIESESGPARKYYKMTSLGLAEYQTKRIEYMDFTNKVTKILGGKRQ